MVALAWSEFTSSGRKVIKQRSFHSDLAADRFIARKMKAASFCEVIAGR